MCYNSANDVWLNLIHRIIYSGNDVEPRGIRCREILSHTSVVDMSRCITTGRPRLGYKFLTAEAWWILTGRNDVESIKKYSSHISSFSNDGVRFDGAYGPKVVDQVRYVVETLEKDPESRQAVIEIWRPNPRPSKDVPCTIAAQWMVRKDRDNVPRLHCFDTMRSSDTWLGWPYDVFNFSMLSAYLALTLRINFKLRYLELGNLHLTAASQHLYVDPKADGANNIPYSLDDAKEIAGNFSPPEYSPLNLEDYHDPGMLVEHLANCKDGVNDGIAWVQELQGVRVG
jgi:thymidylate synthase